MTNAKNPGSVAEILARKAALEKRKAQQAEPEPKPEEKPEPKTAGVSVNKEKKLLNPLNKPKIKLAIKQRKKPAAYDALVIYCASPLGQSEYESQAEISKKFRVSEWTLSQWKLKESFWDEVNKMRTIVMRSKMVNGVLGAVYRKVLSEGTASEAKLLLEMAKVYSQKSTVDINTNEGIPDEKKAEILERLKMWDDDDEE
jgi:hypothetical protein